MWRRRSRGAGVGAGHLVSLWAPERRALTVGLVLTITFMAAEALAVVTIMPQVARDLGGIHLYGWAFSAFLLGSMVGIVAAGRAADRSGPARPYVAGLALFGCGLVVAGLAPSMIVLVCGRVLQGLGAGAVPAVAYVTIGRSFPEQLRARMMAVLSTAWVVPGLVGPLLSAGVAHLFGWRWVFLGLLPLVLVTGGLALPGLAAVEGPESPPNAEHGLIDAVRAAVGTGLIIGSLTSGVAFVALVLAVVGLVLLVPALWRLLPHGTLRAGRGLPTTILSRGLLTYAYFGGDAFVTLAVITVRHDSLGMASIAVTGSTLAWTTGSWVQVRLNGRCQARSLVRAGLVLVLIGAAGMLVFLRPGVPVGVAIAAWSVAGLGMGLAYAPITLMMLREAPIGREGWASASLNLADVLGSALGAGLGGAAIAVGTTRSWSLATGVTIVYALSASIAVAAIAVSGRLPTSDLEPAGKTAD